MSSPIDYIFMDSRDKGVVIINILSSSSISIEFMMRNTILVPRWFELSAATFLPPPPQHKLVHNLCCTLVSLLSSKLFFFTLEYYRPLCQECSEICSPSWEFLTSKYFSPSPFFLGPRVNTNKWAVLFGFCPSSNPIALKLMVGCSFLDYWLLKHHSGIGRATQPIFPVHLSSNV